MKILVVNKYLYPRGGDCIYTLRLMELLREAGHDVIPFAMHHPENISTNYDEYFVPYIDFREALKHKNPKNIISVLARSVVNREAARCMERLINDTAPDIIHLNNIHHQLTPSILKGANRQGIPVVWTLHDYILSCPENTFLCNGEICDKCIQGFYINCVMNKCKKGSFGASLLAALESSIYNSKFLADRVEMFISPSRFLAGKLIEGGYPKDKVLAIPNFLPTMNMDISDKGYFIYCGRLSAEKGVDTLIKAFIKFGKSRLLIAGDGPLRVELEGMVKDSGYNSIEFLGFQPQDKVFELLAGCRAAIVPSVWWENFPFTVLEPMAAGKPVIAARTGGIPEQVENMTTGMLFEPGAVDRLGVCLQMLWDDPELARTMGQAGRDKVQREYNEDVHIKRILELYRNVTGKTFNNRRITQKTLEEIAQ